MKDLTDSLKTNNMLCYLDLKCNLLDDVFADGLISDLLSFNYFFEDIILCENPQININKKEAIKEECR